MKLTREEQDRELLVLEAFGELAVYERCGTEAVLYPHTARSFARLGSCEGMWRLAVDTVWTRSPYIPFSPDAWRRVPVSELSWQDRETLYAAIYAPTSPLVSKP